MKNKSFPIVLLAILVLGGGFALWYFFLRPEKLEFDKVGGTILVYEILPFGERAPDADLAANLARVLEKRLDPEARGLASVRAVGKDRVEIRIARAGNSHGEDVARTKELLAQVGVLEFRILANKSDDKKAIDDAREKINVRAENDPALKKELKDLQEKGLPPPGPRAVEAKELTVYQINLAKNQKSLVTYGWVELGPQERRMLGLTPGGKVWAEAEKNRGRAVHLQENPASGREILLLGGALFYNRVCADQSLPEEDRKKKGVDIFVLARDPELDPKLGADLPMEKRRTPKIDGSYITNAYPKKQRQPDFPEYWSVNFSLNSKGAELFRIITSKNVPTGSAEGESQIRRHLAIILDGLVMSAPTINSEIGGRGQITGDFKEKEVRIMANILNAGALPARIKPFPVSETTVQPKN